MCTVALWKEEVRIRVGRIWNVFPGIEPRDGLVWLGSALGLGLGFIYITTSLGVVVEVRRGGVKMMGRPGCTGLNTGEDDGEARMHWAQHRP